MIPREVFEQTMRQFFAPVTAYLDDPSVTEVLINGPSSIIVERHGKLERTDARNPLADESVLPPRSRLSQQS